MITIIDKAIYCTVCFPEGKPVPIGYLEDHPLFVLENEIICGCCGNSVKQGGLVETPLEIARIIRTLVQKRILQISRGVEVATAVLPHRQAKSPMHTVILKRKEAGGVEVSCKIQWAKVQRQRRPFANAKEEERLKKNKYDRNAIKCYIPHQVHQATSIISDSDGGTWDAMNVTSIHVNGERKVIRLERMARQYAEGHRNMLDPDTELLIRVEIAWTMPDDGMTLYLPVVDMKTIDTLVRTPVSKWHKAKTSALEIWNLGKEVNSSGNLINSMILCRTKAAARNAFDVYNNLPCSDDPGTRYLLSVNGCNASAVEAAIAADMALAQDAGSTPRLPDGVVKLGPELQQAITHRSAGSWGCLGIESLGSKVRELVDAAS